MKKPDVLKELDEKKILRLLILSFIVAGVVVNFASGIDMDN